jgi:hypothetical protein
MYISSKDDILNTPLVLVVWEDISSEHLGWFNVDDIQNLDTAKAYTPGWVVSYNQHTLYMIQALALHKGDLSPSVDLSIPRGCIQTIHKLRNKWQYQPKTSKSKKILTDLDLKAFLPEKA